MKKVIFMGTPSFSVPILQALIEEETIEVAAVVTQPDRKVGRKQILTPSPVKQLAMTYDIPVLQPENFYFPTFLCYNPQLDAGALLPLTAI